MSLDHPPDFKPPKIRFDTTINLGHVLTAMVMMGTLITMWASAKVTDANQETKLLAHDQSINEMRMTMSKIAETQSQNQRTEDKLALTLEFLSKQVANKQ